MNMVEVLTKRIEALESIIEHLRGNSQNRREYYQEKCAIYRQILANLRQGPAASGSASPFLTAGFQIARNRP